MKSISQLIKESGLRSDPSLKAISLARETSSARSYGTSAKTAMGAISGARKYIRTKFSSPGGLCFAIGETLPSETALIKSRSFLTEKPVFLVSFISLLRAAFENRLILSEIGRFPQCQN